MTKIVIVEKPGTLKEVNIKNDTKEELYKKAGNNKPDFFKERTTWTVNKRKIELWAKDVGRANSENKYDFPPPIDNNLYFGNCILIDSNNEDLTIEEWEKMYDKLFGGFENLDETAKEDENEVDELEKVSPSKKTKQGYLKDGFVVDSVSDDDNNNELEESSDTYSETDEDDIDVILEEDTSEDDKIDGYNISSNTDLEEIDLKKEPYVFSSEDEEDDED